MLVVPSVADVVVEAVGIAILESLFSRHSSAGDASATEVDVTALGLAGVRVEMGVDPAAKRDQLLLVAGPGAGLNHVCLRREVLNLPVTHGVLCGHEVVGELCWRRGEGGIVELLPDEAFRGRELGGSWGDRSLGDGLVQDPN